ncbi:acyl-CoA thioesterase [Hymenobacter caeli]|uniref:Acyl-CoA thioester hydrolase n=1 Tax=Hymenobacter caeli TaxID=2735894 RepID=A0ABX2FSP9_9BACT|nr:thioesterase family protein [Hymenobacter caeli]NRT20213.1 acyl-CoA thioester hydrolase [Hymenobacter caeli]
MSIPLASETPAFRFTHDFTVPAAAIDALGHANNVEYVRWVQDVAGAHWLAICPPAQQGQYVWVVREHRIRYHRPAFAGDALRATTWVGETSGATSVRHTRLSRAADAVLLCEAETTWVLLDPQSGRPVRVTEEMVGWLQNPIN